jgi:sec-independent protein translocase protein TatA
MNLGTPELILILFVGLLLFGAKRLPELGRSIGTAMREFRRGAREAEEKSPPGSDSEPNP